MNGAWLDDVGGGLFRGRFCANAAAPDRIVLYADVAQLVEQLIRNQ
jgi:hypothetical protein